MVSQKTGTVKVPEATLAALKMQTLRIHHKLREALSDEVNRGLLAHVEAMAARKTTLMSEPPTSGGASLGVEA
jgi:hypothetical protein